MKDDIKKLLDNIKTKNAVDAKTKLNDILRQKINTAVDNMKDIAQKEFFKEK
jgi:hypothetical protein